MKTLAMIALPLLCAACVTTLEDEPIAQTEELISPAIAKAVHTKAVRAKLWTKVAPKDGPTISCENVLCIGGHECVEDCDGNPTCVPGVCEGFAGLECPDDFACQLESNAPDQGGKCVPDCEPCGECTSNQDCSDDEVCTTSQGACMISCGCPQCDVCAGECVKPKKEK